MTTPLLPAGAWVPVTTRRLRKPEVLWSDSGAKTAGFDPEHVYCCPQDYEALDSYTSESRQEEADRYGGVGVGTAGGSGRCSSFNGLQTKGVGVTPLVGPDSDRFHSSGTLMVVEAATEAVFAGAYQAALPFGAVPVHAVVCTGGKFLREWDFDGEMPRSRALAFRSMVARPAHFMRNIDRQEERRPAVGEAKGLTLDALRTKQALTLLGANLRQTLHLETPEFDDVAALDVGLRELVRRYAWQSAAAFAKRLPHGTLACSNIALSGAYMDFGLSNFVPAYRRLRWALGQDPWNEAQFPLNTLLSLRQQLGKYVLGTETKAVVSGEEMMAIHGHVLQERMAVEMCRMAGLTEDLAMSCPPTLLLNWIRAMQEIWTRGANEQYALASGRMKDNRPTPAPRQRGRYDLSVILAAAGPYGDPLTLDSILRSHLDDSALRHRFVTAAVEVRAWLSSWAPAPQGAWDTYLARQAARKNADLNLLRRDSTTSLTELRRLELSGQTRGIAAAIDAALRQARHVLADMCPDLPGTTGPDQLHALLAMNSVSQATASR